MFSGVVRLSGVLHRLGLGFDHVSLSKKKPPCPGATWCMRHRVDQTVPSSIKTKCEPIVPAIRTI